MLQIKLVVSINCSLFLLLTLESYSTSEYSALKINVFQMNWLKYLHKFYENVEAVGDLPLAKVAEPEGLSKVVTFSNHKVLFFLS